MTDIPTADELFARPFFFCGIGGSGMLPLAQIVRGRGAEVAGSDRSRDQGHTPEKFAALETQGFALHPQDGSGIVSQDQVLVASAAVEDTVPEVVRAKELGCLRVSRAELNSILFNTSGAGLAVAGTSGKSTVTGMLGWIMHAAGRDPTVMNGAVMKNFAAADAPFASALVGQGDAFVSEVDESDGSIALYEPDIAVLNNVSLDHMGIEELRDLFRGFLERAGRAAVNADDPEVSALATGLAPDRLLRFGIAAGDTDLCATHIEEAPLAVSFDLVTRADGAVRRVALAVPGRHNVANALAALSAAQLCGIPLDEAVSSLARFTGLRRRFEVVGTAGGVTVIDDFGHNPDKIAATLSTLHAFPGRLLVFFQPHGYGPLKKMGAELIATFVQTLAEEDILILCDPVYFGGTTDRSVGSDAIVAGVIERGRCAEHMPDREECGRRLAELARPGDRIVVMGARDDSLSEFAHKILTNIG